MRALFLTNRYPPDALGGYERCCADVVDRWRADGRTVAVATSVSSGGTITPTWLDVPVPPRRKRPAADRAARDALAAGVAAARPDVVVVWNVAGLPLSLLGALRGSVPLVFVVADAWPLRAPLGDPMVAPLKGVGLRRAIGGDWSGLGTWCFCSESMRDEIVAGTGEPFPGSAITPLGVDPVDFPALPRQPSPWRDRLLYVGRLDAAKGIDTLLAALARLPAATLSVVGPSERHHLDRLEALAASLGVADRVTFESLERRAIASRYRDADVCVFPSEWAEPFGIVPLEAMACATPVVASGTGGSAEYLVDGTNCVLHTPGDASSIVAAVERLQSSEALRAQVVAGGLQTAQRFTVDRLADQLAEIATAAIG